ncbi:MAG: TVP38/TMEM64 family protein [Erysipelotrichaceae bacterium]
MEKNTVSWKQIAILVVGILGVVALLWPILSTILPELIHIIQTRQYDQIVTYLQSFGWQGAIAVILLQILVVFIAILPSPIIWIPAGIVFGTLFGLIYCTVGMVIGNGLVFWMARKLHIGADTVFAKKAQGFLDRVKNPDVALFLIYTFPGVPNGIIPYVYAPTNYSLFRFCFILGLGSIPSILMSTYIGQALITGKYIEALVVITIVALMLSIVYWKKEWLLDKLSLLEEQQKHK